jgi:hypothetical protein
MRAFLRPVELDSFSKAAAEAGIKVSQADETAA